MIGGDKISYRVPKSSGKGKSELRKKEPLENSSSENRWEFESSIAISIFFSHCAKSAREKRSTRRHLIFVLGKGFARKGTFFTTGIKMLLNMPLVMNALRAR